MQNVAQFTRRGIDFQETTKYLHDLQTSKILFNTNIITKNNKLVNTCTKFVNVPILYLFIETDRRFFYLLRNKSKNLSLQSQQAIIKCFRK